MATEEEAVPVDKPFKMSRYFRNDASISSRDAGKQLRLSLKRLIKNHPPDRLQPGGGLYQGPISIAYTLMILQQLYPDLIIQDHPLADWSAAYLRQANANIKSYPGPMVGSCGVRDDILCLLAIGAGSSKDRSLASELCDYAAEVLDPQSDNDWLSGRAGYLYLLRLVKVSFADDPDTLQLLADTQDDVVAAILEAPRPWRSRGRVQLGAVHGAIGIITQVVLTDPARYAARVEADLAVLLTYQYEGGNFPSLVPPDKDRLVQFCHGAPGVVLSLLSIRDHFPTLQDKITKAIERGRKCIWERGLLTKEPCICHGITGNALALEDTQAKHFLTYTTGGEIASLRADQMCEDSSSPAGLFGGEAGRAWAWAVVDRGLDKRLLGYNDL